MSRLNGYAVCERGKFWKGGIRENTQNKGKNNNSNNSGQHFKNDNIILSVETPPPRLLLV
jgi:hypothetical protein